MPGLLVALLAAAWLAWMPAMGAAPGAAERRDFDAAVRAFTDRFFDRAERELGEFVTRHPESELKPHAVLLRAQAKLSLGDSRGAAGLLSNGMGGAGPFLDEYRFWLAQAQFGLGDWKTAAAGFASVVADFPNSSRRMEAAYREALARFKLGERARAIDLLRQPQGAFSEAARAQPSSEPAVRGVLLLAEALLLQKDHVEALRALAPLEKLSLGPELAWLRQQWLARAQFASGDAEVALATANGLASLADAAKSREFLAESHLLQGNILQALEKFDAAIAAFERNLAENLPADRRRQALLKIIEASLARRQPVETGRWLERFLKDHPQDPSLDVVRLTLGEVRLQQFFALGADVDAAARSNQLAEARSQLDRFLADFPRSPLAGKAQLNRGLIHWEERQLTEARAAFQSAFEQLPASEEQAVARFKLADVLFAQKEFAPAAAHYQSVVRDYESVPRVRDSLADQALHQIVRAGVELGDLDMASAAVATILARYPDSFFGDRSMLVLGQALNRRGQPAQARAMFVEFLRHFPESKLESDVHLAIARTYVQERDWTAGLGKLDEWIRRHTDHVALSRAEFDRAWMTFQAGKITDALNQFTNFIARHPSDALAPLAQNWVADHYWRAGDFPNAEKNYQLLYQNTNWPASELTFGARLMAGRAAAARQGFKEAKDYFAAVFNDESAPPAAALRALLFWGDVLKEEPVADAGRSLEKFAEAINAFTRITTRAPGDPLVPAAWGSIGNCHFQLAAQDPKRYDAALDAYRRALEHPAASVSARSQAEVGMAMVYERQAQARPGPEQTPLLNLALNHCLNIVYGTNLKDQESADPFWVKEAGLRAAALLETQRRWSELVKLYERLLQIVPPMRAVWEGRLETARNNVAAP